MTDVTENRRELIAALRSGKYNQGKFFLRQTDNRYCVVGIMCDLFDNTGWDENPKGGINPRYDGSPHVPGSYVFHSYGLTRHNEVDYLSVVFWMNKSDGGMKFKDIADLMEEKWNLK